MKTEIYWIPMHSEGRLGIAPRPRGGDWLDDEVKAWRFSGVDYVISALEPVEEVELELTGEGTTCASNGIKFVSWPIPDRSVPPSPDQFRRNVREICHELDGGKSILVHCRQGIGRASLIAAAILTECGELPDSALTKIQRARGCVVPDTDDQKKWVRTFAADSVTAKSTMQHSERVAAA